jgi:hypothetical protein
LISRRRVATAVHRFTQTATAYLFVSTQFRTAGYGEGAEFHRSHFSWNCCSVPRTKGQRMSFGHTVRVSITIPLLLAAAACVPQDSAPKAANAAAPAASPAPAQSAAAVAPPTAAMPPIPATAPIPSTAKTPATPAPPATKIITDLTTPRSGVGTATYRCGNGGMITIQNLGSSLRVGRPDGTTEEFAASPANQSSRYQEAATHDAIVIDGREALVMKRGSTPQTCRR